MKRAHWATSQRLPTSGRMGAMRRMLGKRLIGSPYLHNSLLSMLCLLNLVQEYTDNDMQHEMCERHAEGGRNRCTMTCCCTGGRAAAMRIMLGGKLMGADVCALAC